MANSKAKSASVRCYVIEHVGLALYAAMQLCRRPPKLTNTSGTQSMKKSIESLDLAVGLFLWFSLALGSFPVRWFQASAPLPHLSENKLLIPPRLPHAPKPSFLTYLPCTGHKGMVLTVVTQSPHACACPLCPFVFNEVWDKFVPTDNLLLPHLSNMFSEIRASPSPVIYTHLGVLSSSRLPCAPPL